MGVSNDTSAPLPYGASPQQQQQAQAYRSLAAGAMAPYQGSARGGGAANAVRQLAEALMARKLGLPTYNAPGAMPGSVTNSPTPALAAGAVTPGLPGYMAGNQAPGAMS